MAVDLESLLEVRTEVAPVIANSTELGPALGLSPETTLHVIQQENRQDIARQLTEIIAAWLRGADQVATPSWKSLATALVSPNVNRPLIARKIAEGHSCGSHSSVRSSTLHESESQFQDVDSSPIGWLVISTNTINFIEQACSKTVVL